MHDETDDLGDLVHEGGLRVEGDGDRPRFLDLRGNVMPEAVVPDAPPLALLDARPTRPGTVPPWTGTPSSPPWCPST